VRKCGVYEERMKWCPFIIVVRELTGRLIGEAEWARVEGWGEICKGGGPRKRCKS
jgi:hypothetical protein